MNIFLFDSDLATNVSLHSDQLVNKMKLEVLQMIGSVCHNHNIPIKPLRKDGQEYGKGYHLHCCSIWAGATKSNFKWLLQYLAALIDESTKRGYQTSIYVENLVRMSSPEVLAYLPDGDLTDHVLAISRSHPFKKSGKDDNFYFDCMLRDGLLDADEYEYVTTFRCAPMPLAVRCYQAYINYGKVSYVWKSSNLPHFYTSNMPNGARQCKLKKVQ